MDYLSLILFVVLYVGHKVIYRDPFVKSLEADLDTGRTTAENESWETTEPTTWYGKIWHWISG
jgi:amino acid transporter